MASDEPVKCPVCATEMPLRAINRHLDNGCRDPKSTIPSSPSNQRTEPVAVAGFFQPRSRNGVNMSVDPPGSAAAQRGSLPLSQPSPKAVASIFQPRSRPQVPTSSQPTSSPPTDPVEPTPKRPSDDSESGPPPKKKKPSAAAVLRSAMPLAEKMRPKSLDDVCGQDLVGKGGVLRGLIEQQRVPSMVLWGPPGCGKTTIARVIAAVSSSRFVEISATASGVQEVKKVFQEAKSELLLTGRKTILFCDEIHRFTKSQQDTFLAPVESGQITLIGATTENPSFKLVSALLSRCRTFVLKKLSQEDVEGLVVRAMREESPDKSPDEEMVQYIARFADGDARTALNLLELAMDLLSQGASNDGIKKSLTHTLVYDRAGDGHYDTISAFHKSVRGSDPDAALFWLARMIAGGEDPLFIARRMVVIASEDVGLADNSMLAMATAAFTAVQQVGLPEARINLAHCAVALALAKKSTRVYRALGRAMETLEKDPVLAGAPVPIHLRNAPTKLMKELGYGASYKYNPDYVDGRVKQEYLPEELQGMKFLEDRDLGTAVDWDLR